MRRRPRRENPSVPWIPVAIATGLVGLGFVGLNGIMGFTANAREQMLEAETLRRYLQLKQVLKEKYGIDLHTGSTRRSAEQQAANVEKGVSAASISWHMSGRGVDAYPIDPATGQPDLKARRPDLFRIMHREWAKLGGFGLAYSPYPEGPNRLITTTKGKIWDGGHLEFHGPYTTAAAAYNADRGRAA